MCWSVSWEGRSVLTPDLSNLLLGHMCLGRTADHWERGLQAMLQFQTDLEESEGRGWGLGKSSEVPTLGTPTGHHKCLPPSNSTNSWRWHQHLSPRRRHFSFNLRWVDVIILVIAMEYDEKSYFPRQYIVNHFQAQSMKSRPAYPQASTLVTFLICSQKYMSSFFDGFLSHVLNRRFKINTELIWSHH